MQAHEVKKFVLSEGADLVGIASADRFEDVPGYKPKKLMPDAKSVIVIGKKMLKGFVEAGRGRPVCWGCIHLNIKLDEIAYNVANFFEERGHKAMPIFFVYVTFLSPDDKEHFDSILDARWFAYVPAGVLAGLGEVGFNHLLLTPEYGPRVRLIAVITDVPLAYDPPMKEKLCPGAECGLCVEACPVGALSLDGSIDRMKCHQQTDAHQVVLGYSSCAMCINACPLGK